MTNNKAFLLEGQILHQIKKKKLRLLELDRMRNADPKEITEEGYWAGFYGCHGAIDSLTMCLTCHDNPLSNFLCEEKVAKPKKK